MRVAVLGGGSAGLSSAHYLLKTGHVPVVLEASNRLGGLSAPFRHADLELDRFHHLIRETDSPLLGLMAEIGGLGRLSWQETETGVLLDGGLFRVRHPRDLLAPGTLPRAEKLRAALATLWVTRGKRYPLDLDRVRAADWIRALYGPRLYERIWRPLLEFRFAEYAHEVPAYWIWSAVNREGTLRPGKRGWIRGGFGWLTDRLHESIEARGGEVRLRAPVTGVEVDAHRVDLEIDGRLESFEAMVSTLPLPQLAKLARGPLASRIPLRGIPYVGAVCTLLVTRRSPGGCCYTAALDPRFPFQEICETTHVIPIQATGGRHLTYLVGYCSPHTPAYGVPDDVLRGRALDALRAVGADLAPEDIEASYVFRAPEVAPVWTVGYLERRPAARIAETPVYLCTSAQAYPREMSWSTAISLAREAVGRLVQDRR